MPAVQEIAHIQNYLRENARRQYDSQRLPPFTLFFHHENSLKYFNYAIPDRPILDPWEDGLAETLTGLRQAFSLRERTPRFEFFEAFAPGLPEALLQNGFVEEARQWGMICTPADLRAVPDVPGLEITALDPESPDQDLRDFILAQRQGFDPQDTSVPSEQDLAHTRMDLLVGGWRSYLGRMDGQPAGVSLYSRPQDGVAEIAGIATREAFRRHGIAARLTFESTRAAFFHGVQTACLTAADANAGRVYERVGYQPFSTMLAYIEDEV